MKIYPVIHYLDRQTAHEQVNIIRACGADGAFLISHQGVGDDELLNVAWEIKQIQGRYPIGINMLYTPPREAAVQAIFHNLDMVWADNMGVSSDGLTEAGTAISSLAQQHPNIEFFASVAFKYQKHEGNPSLAAIVANDSGFIPTTSGPTTGKPPSVDKIATMAYAVNNNLAVASGMTPDNIALYAPYLNYVLVATGISKDDYRVDEEKLKRFIANANAAILPPLDLGIGQDLENDKYMAIADALDQAAATIYATSPQAPYDVLRTMATEWRSKCR